MTPVQHIHIHILPITFDTLLRIIGIARVWLCIDGLGMEEVGRCLDGVVGLDGGLVWLLYR